MIEPMDVDRDLSGLVIPRAGQLIATDEDWEPYRLLDGNGCPVAPVAAFLREVQAAGRSVATLRSYGM